MNKAQRTPHIPRKFFRAVRVADFDKAASYLAIMIRAEEWRYPGRDDILTVFITSHLACALDLAGYLDMDVIIPIEPIVEQEIQKWHTEYSDAENWDWLIARRSMHAVCALNGLVPQSNSERSGTPCSIPSTALYPERIQMICAFIASHYQDPTFNAASVAKHFDLNMSYLSRSFSKATNLKLGQYIHMYRYQKAKELLITTNLPVSEIAVRSGFSGSSVFIRAFRNHEGMTPGAYRVKLPEHDA